MQYSMLHYLLIQGSFTDRKAFLYEGIIFQTKYPSDIKNERLE